MLILIISSILLAFTVIGTGALAGLFSERSGVINVGIEGFMIIGGLTYIILSEIAKTKLDQTGIFMQIPLFLISFIVTMLISSLHAYASITLKANQVISGMAINLLAAGVAVFVVNVVYSGGIAGMTNRIENTNLNKNYGISISLFITIFLFIGAFFLLRKTKYGLRLRAAGENPHALESQGISVIKTRYQAVLISGGLAGLAGAFFVQ
jgi:simple sugar transport system permease protein